jgi:predicted ATP-grasp superfamily ATP-dependent carboligase
LSETSFKLHDDVKFECASLIVGWYEDSGNTGYGSLNYLKDKLNCRLLAEIEPAGYFPMNNILISDDVAQFPESKLYYCPDKQLLLFLSSSPSGDWYKFLNTVIDMASYHCRLLHIYFLGGMVALNSHTAPRQISAVVSAAGVKKVIQGDEIDTSMDYETPEGQRPTMNSFLMWIAKKREIPSAGFWIPVPFYFAGVDDPRGWLKILEFLDKSFDLGLDFADLDKIISAQEAKISRARNENSELDEIFKRLETGQLLTPEENEKVAAEIEEILKPGS